MTSVRIARGATRTAKCATRLSEGHATKRSTAKVRNLRLRKGNAGLRPEMDRRGGAGSKIWQFGMVG